MKRTVVLVLVVVTAFVGCRQRYDPDIKSLEQTFLVVEGNLNAGGDSTVLRLTRTFKLDAASTPKTENNAQLTVEGKDNTTRSLTGRGNGYYVSLNLNLILNNEYRLRIKTSDGKEYVSDYVKVKKTPLIDSISWERTPDGVDIFANTKDPSNATRYYRWEYDETWEIRSSYYSGFVYATGGVRPRNFPQEDVSVCWKYASSTSIPLANSTRLQEDIIYKAPLTRIPPRDERLGVRYSILVRQYGLEKEAYNFYELMKKNTEEIGSIFNPQPSELRGNIHCVTDRSEYVLGYVTASTVEKQRIFIQVTQWGFTLTCETKDVTLVPDSTAFYLGSGQFIPVDFLLIPPHYSSASPRCVDCTRRGGSIVKPSYW
jgi:hypothetical protein